MPPLLLLCGSTLTVFLYFSFGLQGACSQGTSGLSAFPVGAGKILLLGLLGGYRTPGESR